MMHKPRPLLAFLLLGSLSISPGCAEPEELSLSTIQARVEPGVLQVAETSGSALVMELGHDDLTSRKALVCYEAAEGLLAVKYPIGEIEMIEGDLEIRGSGGRTGCVSEMDLRIDVYSVPSIGDCADGVAQLTDVEFYAIELGESVASKAATATGDEIACWQPSAWQSPIGGTVLLPIPTGDDEQAGISIGTSQGPGEREPVELIVTTDDLAPNFAK